jgi:MFS transporter, MHS family, shikimate and dehydroshikimate transport protein
MLVSTSNIWMFLLGGLIVQACRATVYGPQSAYFAEQFSTRMRYSGCSLAYQFAAIVGGMTPLVCTALIALTGTLYSVAVFVIVIALVSLTCSYLMTETLRSGLRSDYILSLRKQPRIVDWRVTIDDLLVDWALVI